MKKIFVVLAAILGLTAQAQNGANEILPAPNSSTPYILVDTLFTLANHPATYTDIYVHFANPTATPVKAVQFRLFYDNTKFSGATMFWGPTAQSVSDKYGSYFDVNASGYINVVATYTGTNTSYDWNDGAMFKLRLNHGSNYKGVTNSMAITGASSYTNLATVGNGTDVALTLFNYGGAFQMTPMTFPVRAKNADGSPAQGVWFSAAKRLKSTPQSTWIPISADSTNTAGLVEFTHPLDTNYWHLKIAAQTDSMTDGGAISITDAYKLANHVTGQDTLAGIEWYAGDINQSQTVTISDGFAVFNRLALQSTTWSTLFTGVNNVTMLWPSEYDPATLATGAPNWATTPRRYAIDTIVNSLDSINPYIYVVGDATTTGYNNPATILAKINPTGGGITEYVLDPAVYMSNKPDTVQFRFPKLVLTTDNFVDIPVTMYTFGNSIGAAQMGFEYDTNIFEFISIEAGPVAAKWTSLISVEKGRVFWAGHEDKMNPAVLQAMSNAFTFRFRVKSILGWTSAPLRIFDKAAGNERAVDLSVKPSPNDGSIINGRATLDPTTMEKINGFYVYPNPVSDATGGWAVAEFYTEDKQPLTMVIANMQGQILKAEKINQTDLGFQYKGIYLGDLPKGTYFVRLVMNDRDKVYKLIKY
jgi:hypothetical protein